MGRGQITDRVQSAAMATLRRKITQAELRLMPYVQFVMMNEQKLDPNKVSAEEREILADWRKEGWIEGGAAGLAITKDFWNALCECLWASYVAYGEEDCP